MKKTNDKVQVALKWYSEGRMVYEIALALHTTKATIFRWLKEEGIRPDRKGEKGDHLRSSECGKLADKLGVSLPTARKYLQTLKDIELAGVVTPADLQALGIGKAKQKLVVAFLGVIGYTYAVETMTLADAGGSRVLATTEVVNIFTDPGAFIGRTQ
jgi:hypothetical protein